jgi:hypothetical protein
MEAAVKYKEQILVTIELPFSYNFSTQFFDKYDIYDTVHEQKEPH